MERSVLLAAAVRTPIGKFNGGLASQTAVDLGTAVCKETIRRSGLAPDQVDQVIFGHARQAGCGPNPARQVAIRSEIPVEKTAMTINQACLSGMQSILAAIRAIRLDEAEVVVAGGMEAMSRVPYMLDARWGFRMGHQELTDGMYRDGFHDPICDKLMGQTAETLATRGEISREEQDAYAARSQQRAEIAVEHGRFDAEMMKVDISTRKGVVTVERDEHPRAGVTADGISRMRPVFQADGTVTAANSSGITDGASAMVVASEEAVERLNLEPLARVCGYQVEGVDPEVMGIGPVPAVRRLLKRTEVALDEIDLVELNEAFAAQVLAVDRELGFDPEKLNVNGGAIALGHPIGCSGNRVVVTLLHELARREARLGLATLCVSGGLGGALLLERVAG
ncbi:MAG: acetyl-CoA C-acetyltransferase [Acidobacteriota bacterium]|nr:acetyl-CoA C-acetyltransferase [Acidobacteriota bacterium]MDH3786483.1 acetyl-CoA C-acetyltransferase [Acidobacteriota bacterium]